MRDPTPENISGEKVQRHVFKHEINWGYVAVSVAVVFAVYVAVLRHEREREESEL